eukprot:5396360-Prymnesium_polylepis.1
MRAHTAAVATSSAERAAGGATPSSGVGSAGDGTSGTAEGLTACSHRSTSHCIASSRSVRGARRAGGRALAFERAAPIAVSTTAPASAVVPAAGAAHPAAMATSHTAG